MSAKTIGINAIALAIISALIMLLISGTSLWMPGARGHEALAAFVFIGLAAAGGIWSLFTWFGVESWVDSAYADDRLAARVHKFQMLVKTNFAFGMFFTFLSVMGHGAAIYCMVIALHRVIF